MEMMWCVVLSVVCSVNCPSVLWMQPTAVDGFSSQYLLHKCLFCCSVSRIVLYWSYRVLCRVYIDCCRVLIQ